MNFETLDLQLSGAICRLTLNRPDRLNAMSLVMLRELVEAANWLDTQPEIRVVIICGAGRAFSAGADLKDSSRTQAETWFARREIAKAGSKMMDAIESTNALTIASVHGYAVGGAVLLIAACDLRVAAADARFSIPEVELGIPLTWGGIPRLVREIGPAMTKELVITCREFGADEAKAIGFMNKVVPADQLAHHTTELAEKIVAMPAVPVAITKEHVNAVSRAIAGNTSYADADVLMSSLASAEGMDARKAYIERRLDRKRKG
ncbi:MAG TPA: enoyl-CoA hydratase/isomerase family protein [Blastocatellia bacterium]|nr:enoyl-CoA hydratase/isomerase family protein [Blastocatellia bacterium]